MTELNLTAEFAGAGPQTTRYHMANFMLAMLPYLSNEIRTIHEYGCRYGTGVSLLRDMGYEVKGFDIEDRLWDETIKKNIADIDEYADLVIALSVFESNQVQPIRETLKKVFDHCRYVGIGVHEPVSNMGAVEGDIQGRVVAKIGWNFLCYFDEHTLYLLRGNR